MKHDKTLTRRNFLTQSARYAALGAAGPLVFAKTPHAAAANDRIGIGYIGVGRRAKQLMTLPPEAETVAYADVNRKRLEEMAAKNPKAKTYPDYRDLLDSPDVDAVIIASPDHWHALHSIHAMEAGKDVYIEKPMTLTIREGRLMAEAAERYARIVQAGTQQRSMPENRFACELVRNGRLGKLRIVHGANYQSPWECTLPRQGTPDYIDWDMWCGPTEPRAYHEELYLPRVRGHEAGWISFITYSGGEMTGWGAHGFDQIQWALGVEETGPVTVEPLLDKVPPFDHEHMGPRCQVRYTFPGGVELVMDDKAGYGAGGLFEGEKGSVDILRADYTASDGVDTSPIPEGGVHLYDSLEKTLARNTNDATAVHIGNWLHCVQTREQPASGVLVSHKASILCHLGNIARWTQRKLEWDYKNERFVNDAEANTYLDRERRQPWVL